MCKYIPRTSKIIAKNKFEIKKCKQNCVGLKMGKNGFLTWSKENKLFFYFLFILRF